MNKDVKLIWEAYEQRTPVPFDLEERKRLWAAGTISSKLPIKFQSTGLEWQQITGSCAKCGKNIEDDKFHGTIEETFKDVYKLEAVGYCKPCDILTCFKWTMNPHGLQGRNSKGEWVQWAIKPGTFFGKLKAFLKKLF